MLPDARRCDVEAGSRANLRAEQWRLLATVLTGVFVVLFVRDMLEVTQWRPDQLALAIGGDYRAHMDAAQRVLESGAYYVPDQLTGPYPVRGGDALYPPVILYVLIPVYMVPEPLRSIVWWGVPLAIVVGVIIHHRPAWWSWPLLAACLWWWRTSSQVIHGNVVIWITAAVALGTIYRWPAVLALVKLPAAPFALVGIRSRGWWAGLVGLVVLSLPFLRWTQEYPTVLSNLQTGGGLYALAEYPLLLLPVVASVSRSR